MGLALPLEVIDKEGKYNTNKELSPYLFPQWERIIAQLTCLLWEKKMAVIYRKADLKFYRPWKTCETVDGAVTICLVLFASVDSGLVVSVYGSKEQHATFMVSDKLHVTFFFICLSPHIISCALCLNSFIFSCLLFLSSSTRPSYIIASPKPDTMFNLYPPESDHYRLHFMT